MKQFFLKYETYKTNEKSTHIFVSVAIVLLKLSISAPTVTSPPLISSLGTSPSTQERPQEVLLEARYLTLAATGSTRLSTANCFSTSIENRLLFVKKYSLPFLPKITIRT